jgi:hypothetical protein
MNTTTKHPVIALTPVVSSQIAGIGYDPETQTLAVQFTGKAGPGSLYHYANFTPEQYAAFSGAESAGSHFIKQIKPKADAHPYVKIDEPGAVPGLKLPGGQSYSTTTFKENGAPILLNSGGMRSVFCDVDE